MNHTKSKQFNDKITIYNALEGCKDFSEIADNALAGGYEDKENNIHLTLVLNSQTKYPHVDPIAVLQMEEHDGYVTHVNSFTEFKAPLPAIIKPSDLTSDKIAEILQEKADYIMEEREQKMEQARLDSQRTALVDAAYEMYKAQWMAEHISVDRQIELMRNALSDFIEDAPGYSFAEYLDNILFDNGYNGEYYASKEEFLDEEFQDIDYMHWLLQDDSLINFYDEMIGQEIEESEPLFSEER